jgi:type II secretory ATPase GspE/PulE/Tfp pilus assembly ATPase PilB-like protein
LVSELLRQALDLNVSDIHIEPHEHHAQLRFRIDGRLQSFHPLSVSQYASLSSFLMHDLTNMNLRDTQNPQEGSFQHTYNNVEYHINLSVLPVLDGQKINLHIQARSTNAPRLDTLGLWGPALTRTKHALTNTNGLILVSGPGKSGKTATLHALLKTVHSTHVSMVSIEEESPYSEPYITHVGIDAKTGSSWDKALAASLKHDPDIVSIQRLQDTRTTRRAVEAA